MLFRGERANKNSKSKHRRNIHFDKSKKTELTEIAPKLPEYNDILVSNFIEPGANFKNNFKI